MGFWGVIVAYNTKHTREVTAMSLFAKKFRPRWADDRLLIYAALFLVCALLSTLGGELVRPV